MTSASLCLAYCQILMSAAVDSSPALLTVERAADQIHFKWQNNTLAKATLPDIDGHYPECDVQVRGPWVHVRVRYRLPEAHAQNDVAIAFVLNTARTFWWGPHLAPNPGDVMAQHVFRSPAIITAGEEGVLAMIPDLDLCGRNEQHPWYLDMDAPGNRFFLGMSHTHIPEHVRYEKKNGMVLGPGDVELGFYLALFPEETSKNNPWRETARFLWETWGRPLYNAGAPAAVPLDLFVEHTYRWAFETWAPAVWQQFELNGKPVGAPAFIVNVTESPNYPGEPDLREFLSLWNQAWFSSLRAASGLFRYGRRTGRDDLLDRARMTLDFTLAAPKQNGLFPTVYRTEMEEVEKNGNTVHRSKGWQTGYWTNSNRVPWEHGVTDQWHNVLDMSWTCLLLLRWHEELEADARILPFVQEYAERLLQLQDEQGFFPSWLHPDTEAPSPVLAQSPQTSMSVTLLLALFRATGAEQYRTAALRALDAVIRDIIPQGRWEDFETYWSCCGYGRDHLGKRFSRNAMYKQCNFSMFWTAEALLAAWRETGNDWYLSWGQRTLDELSMTQQIWQPPFIHIPALGGFGVMNFDGEWNDARQSLFAELFMDYYAVTGETAYFERGIAALKASFVMMYCPENPEVKRLWEKVWPFFKEEDYGFTMENYGHGGATSPDGEGMGNFTIYTWGNGAAAEAWNRILDHYGDVYVDRKRNHVFAIEQERVAHDAGRFTIKTGLTGARPVKIVYEAP